MQQGENQGGTATGVIWSCRRPLVPRTAAVPGAWSVAAPQCQAGSSGLLRRAWRARRALPAAAAWTRGPALPASGLRTTRSLGTMSEAGRLRRALSKKSWFFRPAPHRSPLPPYVFCMGCTPRAVPGASSADPVSA